ncbi:hypothetical protein [Nocardia sp. NPDC052112]|uniref:hypothetical protein n=1 Tax=Nocardia sp. NPDC052112 TaxID=3155646 RepID=UPI00344327EA
MRVLIEELDRAREETRPTGDLTEELLRHRDLDLLFARIEEQAVEVVRRTNRARALPRILEHKHPASAIEEITAHGVRRLNLDYASTRLPVVRIITALERGVASVIGLAGAVERALDPTAASDFTLDRSIALAHDRAHALERTVAAMMRALNDFVGADLHGADPAQIPLTGVVWSNTTQWPPDRYRSIVRASVEIRPGVFVIRV